MGMSNGLFESSGIRINEIDQSIVPPLLPDTYQNQVIFIQSDWGPEWQFVDQGPKQFKKLFSTPKNIDTLDKLSWDQQYRLSSTTPLYVIRLNEDGYKSQLQVNVGGTDYVPVQQKYNGEYGNKLGLKFLEENGIYSIYVFEVDDSQMLLEQFSQRTLDSLRKQVNDGSDYIYISTDFVEDGVWDQLKIPDNVDLEDQTFHMLVGGQNGSRNPQTNYMSESPVNTIDLSNRNEYEYTFIVSQGQLTSEEVNQYQQLQKQRKDFVVLQEVVPEGDERDPDTGYPVDGWEIWSKYVQNNPNLYSQRYLTNMSGSYISIYHPWLYDITTEGNMVQYPPSVYVMEQFVQQQRGQGNLWDQVQGITRGSIFVEPVIVLNQVQKDKMYVQFLNPIVKFQGEGTFIWGNKTHYFQNSQLNRLNQRMVQIYLETRMEKRMKEFLFEPMIQSTFDQISQQVQEILEDTKTKGGIVDYRFELDIRPEYIERNYLQINIQFIPTKQLEFIELRFIVKNYSQEL